LKSILESFFKGINQASPNDFTPQLHHHFHLWVINIILNGIFNGIIVVSLLVIDAGGRIKMYRRWLFSRC